MRTWDEQVPRPQQEKWEGHFRNHPYRQDPLGCYLLLLGAQVSP